MARLRIYSSFLLLVFWSSDVETFRGESLEDQLRTGAECWFPAYYCSTTAANQLEAPYTISGDASDCQSDCLADGDCNYFTWFKRRNDRWCYKLKECGQSHQVYSDWCLQDNSRSCYSGPSACAKSAGGFDMSEDESRSGSGGCSMLQTYANKKVEWQCEDGGPGHMVNGYEEPLATGTRCLLSCDSWVSYRWESKLYRDQEMDDLYLSKDKGYIFSECQDDGTWTDVLPYDYTSGFSELFFPSLPQLDMTEYPKPDADPPACTCADLSLAWPPEEIEDFATSTPFHYNPRHYPGATMECEDEIYEEDVLRAQEFRIESHNTCRFFCDDYLVATVKCVDGKWTGDYKRGFWCYEYPVWEEFMSVVVTEMRPKKAYMSSEFNAAKSAAKCIDGDTLSSKCQTQLKPNSNFPWFALEMDCVATLTMVRFWVVGGKLASNFRNVDVMMADSLPTSDTERFDGEVVHHFVGPADSFDIRYWDLPRKNGKYVVVQPNITDVDPACKWMSMMDMKVYGYCNKDFALRNISKTMDMWDFKESDIY